MPGIRKILPGNTAANIILVTIGGALFPVPFIMHFFFQGNPYSSLVAGLSSALFIAGFLGWVNTSILAKEIANITTQPFEDLGFIAKVRGSGLRDIFSSRSKSFEVIQSEIRSEKNQIVIIGSSLKGLFGSGDRSSKRKSPIKSDCEEACKAGVKINILMTHPQIAHHRSQQERRRDGDIEYEIIFNLIQLLKMKYEYHEIEQTLSIKLYSGTPTIFLFASSDTMILNPYPYYSTAYSSFTFLIKAPSELYNNYLQSHYQLAWEDSDLSKEIPDDLDPAKTFIRELIESRIEPGDPSGRKTIPSDEKRSQLISDLDSIRLTAPKTK